MDESFMLIARPIDACTSSPGLKTAAEDQKMFYEEFKVRRHACFGPNLRVLFLGRGFGPRPPRALSALCALSGMLFGVESVVPMLIGCLLDAWWGGTIRFVTIRSKGRAHPDDRGRALLLDLKVLQVTGTRPWWVSLAWMGRPPPRLDRPSGCLSSPLGHRFT